MVEIDNTEAVRAVTLELRDVRGKDVESVWGGTVEGQAVLMAISTLDETEQLFAFDFTAFLQLAGEVHKIERQVIRQTDG